MAGSLPDHAVGGSDVAVEPGRTNMDVKENQEKEERPLFQSAIDAEKASSAFSPLMIGAVAGIFAFLALAVSGVDAKLTLIIALVVGSAVSAFIAENPSN